VNITKANANMSTEDVKDIISDFLLLSERNQILVAGMIKGIVAISETDQQNIGA
jgi:hypothetical protein